MAPDLPTPDGMLIASVLAGETDQFAELVQRYEGALLRVARSRLGRPDWAEDVVQETFLSAFKSLASYDSQYSFRTWLWTILLNQCRRHYRVDARRPEVRGRSDELPAVAAGEIAAAASGGEAPDDRLLAAERAARLDTLLHRLPEAQADALRLRFFGGLKFREIADAMECSLSTAKNRVRWGLTRMAEMLGGDSPASGSSALENCHARSPDL